MDKVICKELIVTTLTKRGDGSEYNPNRIITQVFEKDGTLVAEHDTFNESFCVMDLVHFATWCVKNELQQNITPNDVNKWLDSINNH
jgi:hypothetical protein